MGTKSQSISVTGNSYPRKMQLTSSGVKVGDDLSDSQVTDVVRRLIQNLKLENARSAAKWQVEDCREIAIGFLRSRLCLVLLIKMQ